MAYPNPWRPSSGGAYDARGITFQNLTAKTTIRIFSVNGELMRTMENAASDGDTFLWDVKNESGQNLASGVYFYSAQNSNGEIQTGKVAIIR